MHFDVLTPAAIEPVTVDDVKAYLRLDHSESDSLIAAEIAAARMACERFTGLALISQQLAIWADDWPMPPQDCWWDGMADGAYGGHGKATAVMNLPIAPLINLTAIDLIEEDGTATPWLPLGAYVTGGLLPALVLKQGKIWPRVRRRRSGIRIAVTAGYGPTADDVPAALRQGIIQLVVHRFDHPADAHVPAGVRSLWSSFRRIGR